MFLVELIFAFIFATVLPNIIAEAMHHSVLERTLEVATIGPFETAIATHFILGPLSCVFTAISPEVNAFFFLDSVSEISVIIATITPYFDTLSILFISIGYLRLSLESIQVVLDIEANILSEYAQIGLFILLPESFIDFIAIAWCPEHSETASLAIDPVAFEGALVRPDHLTISAFGVLVINH